MLDCLPYLHTVQSLRPDEHLSVVTDVSSKESVGSCFQHILEKYKRAPDIIVNSAGITKDGFMLRMKEEDFDQVIDVNLKGTFLVTQVGFTKYLPWFCYPSIFKSTGSCHSDEGEWLTRIRHQHCQHCSQDWRHWNCALCCQ